MDVNDSTVFVLHETDDWVRRLEAPLRGRRLAMRHVEVGPFLDAIESGASGCVIADAPRALGADGSGLLEALDRRGIDLPVILAARGGGVRQAVEAMKRGAFEYLERPFSDGVLLESIDLAVVEGRQRAARRLQLRELHERVERLTPRERQVLDLVVSGNSNRVVAETLGVSCKTIEAHRASMMRKMRAKNVVDLVRLHLCMNRRESKELEGLNGYREPGRPSLQMEA